MEKRLQNPQLDIELTQIENALEENIDARLKEMFLHFITAPFEYGEKA